MDKEKEVKKAGKVSDKVVNKEKVPKIPLQLKDFLSSLPKDIDVRETRKGTILRHGKTYIMHVSQSPRGVHSFHRTKTGKHLDSRYASTEKELDVLLQEIDNKIKSGEESKSASSPSKGK